MLQKPEALPHGVRLRAASLLYDTLFCPSASFTASFTAARAGVAASEHTLDTRELS